MIYAMSVPPVETTQAVARTQQQASGQGKTNVQKSAYCVDVDDASTVKEFQAGSADDQLPAYNTIPALLGPMGALGYERDTTTVQGDFILPPNVQASLKTYVITPPKHGVFKLIDATNFIYGYYPESGYLGADSVVYGFDAMAKDGHMVHFVTRVNFAVVQGAGAEPMQCESMKFSYAPETPTWNLSVPVDFSTLANGEVGATTGEGTTASITLSPNAAGYGWFTDSNLVDTSTYFLPTSNQDVWMAKPGSAAAGKMDLLSVLLHEYGHALGLDHSPDSTDFMGAVLQPGERRLPSQAELALMTKLVAQLQGSGASTAPIPGAPNPLPLGGGALALVLAGRLRRNGYGASTMDVQSARLEPEALTAPNPALTNGTFNSSTGWSTSGTVQVAAGTATLSDNTSAQSRLSQAFVFGTNDRFLRFTVSNVALQNPGDRPEDAFEVSLLNAGSGVTVSTPIGLSHTDALLNLQADGHMFLGQNVSFVTNADGSRTYIVDLRNVPTGTAVNLSFDLISFDPSASHVTISNVATFAVPHANDAAFNGLESGAVATTLTGNVLVNDGNVYGATPVIVQGPAHGKLTLNPDGSFVYTPDYLFYGNDSFSYALSNGGIQSNTATVSLTVKYVNQPPTASASTCTP